MTTPCRICAFPAADHDRPAFDYQPTAATNQEDR